MPRRPQKRLSSESRAIAPTEVLLPDGARHGQLSLDRCLALGPDGNICGEFSCPKHTLVRGSLESYYPSVVWKLAQVAQEKQHLASCEGEIAYLTYLIEQVPFDARLTAFERYDIRAKMAVQKAKLKILNQKLQITDQSFIHEVKLRKIIEKLYLMMSRYIPDELQRRKLATEMADLVLSLHSATTEAA